MSKEKVLIILCGTDDSINYFRNGVLPSFDTFEQSNYAELHLTKEDAKSGNVLGDTKSAVDFIQGDHSTQNVENIFFYIHSTDLDFVKVVATDINKNFKSKFSNIKFVYLMTDQEPLAQSTMNEIVRFQKELDFDYNIEDMMKKEVKENEQINILRERLYLLGDAMEISLILNEVPSELQSRFIEKMNNILSEI